MVSILYSKRKDEEYLEKRFTDKLTMSEGIENESWCEIAELVEECAVLADHLTARLGELQSLMFNQYQCYIKDQDGNFEGIDSYDIEDMVDQVEEIANNLGV